MTRVYCTNKLKDFIGNVDKSLPDDFNNIKSSDWNAHLFFVDKRKCIVFVNNLTYYTIFIADIVKKDLKNIEDIFKKRLEEQLLQDRVIDNFENAKILIGESEMSFIRTNNNKRVIGRINDFIGMFKVHCLYKYGHLNEMDIVYENGLINKIPTGKYTDIKKSFSNPIENLMELMKASTK